MSIKIIWRAQVQNYDNFLSHFNDDQKFIKDSGINIHEVYRDLENQNTVTITADTKDINTAKTFFSSEELAKRIVKQGVASTPEIYLLNNQNYNK